MNDISIRAPVPPRAAPADAPPHHSGWAVLRNRIATWDERMRFRWKLERMSKDNPHLIDDIGLTRRQVETEIAKSFWQR